jgi:hypothetical protein
MRIGRLKTDNTPIVGGILWLTAIHMAVCVLVFVLWRITDDNLLIERFFRYQGSLFFVLCAATEAWLAWSIFRQFSQGEPLRVAWLFIALASLYRFVGYIFSQILGVESYLNPLFLSYGAQDASYYMRFQRFGLFIGGPLSMALLAAGLYPILRVLRRLGFFSRLRAIDYFLIAVVVTFTLRQAWEIVNWMLIAPVPYDLYKMLGWASDPLLSILLIEAILIRRSAVETGCGLLAGSWGSFAMGIFLTSMGDIGIWATSHGYLPWPYSSVAWYVWFLASAAYALGPAFQVEAYRHAFSEARITAADAHVS